MVRRIIERNISPRAAAGIGALVALPTIGGGLLFDDYVLRSAALGAPFLAAHGPLDMFRFADGVAAHARALKEAGFFPWFVQDDARAAFFRPLSALTHWLDFAALRLAPWAMHLESIAWYALLVFLAARLFRRVIPRAGVAGLAALVYAVDPGHALPVGWLANRNAVIAAALGVAALLAHDRARREGWRAGALVGPVCLALALAAGESGLATAGYLVAHALTLDRAPPRARALSLAPHAAVLVLWQLAYRALGYGVSGSTIYVDPAHSPAAYAVAVVQHLPALLASALVLFPAEALLFVAPAAWALAALAALVVALAARALAPIVRRDAGARFFAAGALLATLPACATFPSARLMLLPGLGVIGLLAMLLADVAERVDRRAGARALAWPAAVAHVPLGPVLFVAVALLPLAVARRMDAWFAGIPTTPELAGKALVVVRTPDVMITAYRFMGELEPADPRRPRAMHLLTIGKTPSRVRRVDERTLDVHSDDGFETDPIAFVFRSTPLRVGETSSTSDMTATVTEADPRGAYTVRFRFATPLEDPSRTWITFDGTRFVPYDVHALH